MPKVLKIIRMQCLQYLKEKLSYEVDVLDADKHGNVLQVESIIFHGFVHTCPKLPG